MRHESATSLRIQKARTTLLLDHPFFGTLLYRLVGRESHSVRTMMTDGKSIFFNPSFVETLNSPQLCGVLAHEVMHPALQHHLRRSGRNLKRWNRACDYAINPLLLDSGLTLPDDALVEDRFRQMSAEQIYNLLEEEEGSGQREGNNDAPDDGGDGVGSGNQNGQGPNAPETPGGFGQVVDAPETHQAGGDSAAEEAQEWRIAVQQAETVAKLAGKLPAGLERTVEAAEEAQVDWRELLRRAWSETTPSDYSWSRPNRRHIWQGVYLPGVRREGTGEVAIFVDCSGSIGARLLALFEAEVRSIAEEQQPSQVYVVYFDTQVHRVDTFGPGQPIRLAPTGGGGTDFRPCFDWVEQQQVQAQVLVFLTDLYGAQPESPPSIPVVWASTGARHAPFGQVVPMHAA